ncbi:carbon-nitrogen family hydrolase [Actinoplanes sichuanensis]|uniref:Carbon-nitrogen hydrolase family protein n=1 Tax=Actinoplanes sichuanensis TaxID=512349 RepID=A0ABW3ZZQ7_9ACTN|nr:carbon-nitrogen hydrolase family protein [Actinoplanes sichuanensis]BEL08044.1 carbon-nitrogen family hydrolase [Actinoplanes sichuanensis]
MRIGACQTPELLDDVPAALATVEEFAARPEASGMDVLLFPECFLQGYTVTPEHLLRTGYDLASPSFAAILERLAPIRPTLVLGLIERRGTRFHNTAAVISGGTLLGAYRKTHLVDGEAAFTPGDGYPVFDIGGVRFGINICYDTRFPAPAAAVAAQGARVLLVPAQNMMRRTNAEHWKPLHHRIRAERARETGMWLVSADVTGERGTSHIGYGPTSVISPAGEVLTQVAPMTVGLVTVEIAP